MPSLWVILYWTWCASEVLLVVVTRTRRHSGGTVRDRGSIFVLWIVIFGSIWVGSEHGYTHGYTMFGGAHWLRTASLGMMVAGLAIRWVSIVSLGRAFSVNVAIRADQKLYRRGLFAVVRHPSYTGMMIIFAAIGVRTRNWMALAILVIPTFAALLYRMRVEEAALGQAFGQDFLENSKTSTRRVPGFY
jgi:protein-S-isoprenylcysteine O-methyltransferase Ste14